MVFTWLTMGQECTVLKVFFSWLTMAQEYTGVKGPSTCLIMGQDFTGVHYLAKGGTGVGRCIGALYIAD